MAQLKGGTWQFNQRGSTFVSISFNKLILDSLILNQSGTNKMHHDKHNMGKMVGMAHQIKSVGRFFQIAKKNFAQFGFNEQGEWLTYVKIDGTALLLRMSPSSSRLVFHQGKLLCVLIVIHLVYIICFFIFGNFTPTQLRAGQCFDNSISPIQHTSYNQIMTTKCPVLSYRNRLV